ncbi:uncharacterized protein BDV17DRAFT_288393 [Aspergillus undulatus]|uniref:uncharacterized protein n=1 Tax=Aspergillus undulatus TaxID=1810928 RepID=UPI003CCE355E
MAFQILPVEDRRAVLFRAEHSGNTTFRSKQGYMSARNAQLEAASLEQDFHHHLSGARGPTPFISFGTRARAMNWRQKLKEQGHQNFIVITIWAKDLPGIYSAEDVVSQLGYPQTGHPTGQTISGHHNEYLVEGGIAPDEYRILAIFEGGGDEPGQTVVFDNSPLYHTTTIIPDGFFPERRSGDALRDLDHEIHRRLGVRNEEKRDELVKAISGSPRGPIVGEIVYKREWC